jgi:hypothetical protein
MMIKIKSPLIMFLFGFGQFPTYVEAGAGLWWQWFFRPRTVGNNKRRI